MDKIKFLLFSPKEGYLGIYFDAKGNKCYGFQGVFDFDESKVRLYDYLGEARNSMAMIPNFGATDGKRVEDLILKALLPNGMVVDCNEDDIPKPTGEET